MIKDDFNHLMKVMGSKKTREPTGFHYTKK